MINKTTYMTNVKIDFQKGHFLLYDKSSIPVIFNPLELFELLDKLSDLMSTEEQFNLRFKLSHQTSNFTKRHLYAYNETELLCWLVDLKIEGNQKIVNACLNFDLKNENIAQVKQFMRTCLM